MTASAFGWATRRKFTAGFTDAASRAKGTSRAAWHHQYFVCYAKEFRILTLLIQVEVAFHPAYATGVPPSHRRLMSPV